MNTNQKSAQFEEIEPLMTFSFYLWGRKNVLLKFADEIIENLDEGFSNSVIKFDKISRAESLMWLWTLGAYEVMRTMRQAKDCFSDKTINQIIQFTTTLELIRVPAAKMEKAKVETGKGKNLIPVTSNRSPAKLDIPNKDLLVNHPENTPDISARSVIKEFDCLCESRVEKQTNRSVVESGLWNTNSLNSFC